MKKKPKIPVAGKKKRNPLKGLRWRMASQRILKKNGFTNNVKADTFVVLDEIMSGISRHILIQCMRLANSTARNKQKKQHGLKPYSIYTAVMTMVEGGEEERNYMKDYMVEHLRNLKSYSD